MPLHTLQLYVWVFKFLFHKFNFWTKRI